MNEKRDRWSELARQARLAKAPAEPMPLGFEEAVRRRLVRAGREHPIDAWAPMLRPALSLACAAAILCVILQDRARQPGPASLLIETENLIQFTVPK